MEIGNRYDGALPRLTYWGIQLKTNFIFAGLAVIGHIGNLYGFLKIILDIITNKVTFGSFLSMGLIVVLFIAFNLLLQKSTQNNGRITEILAIVYSITLPTILCLFYIISSIAIIQHVDIFISDRHDIVFGNISKISIVILCLLGITVLSYSRKMPRRFMQYSIFPFVVLAVSAGIYLSVGGGIELLSNIDKNIESVIAFLFVSILGIPILAIGGAILIKLYSNKEKNNEKSGDTSQQSPNFNSGQEEIQKQFNANLKSSRSLKKNSNEKIEYSLFAFIICPILFIFILNSINLTGGIFTFIGLISGLVAAFFIHATIKYS